MATPSSPSASRLVIIEPPTALGKARLALASPGASLPRGVHLVSSLVGAVATHVSARSGAVVARPGGRAVYGYCSSPVEMDMAAVAAIPARAGDGAYRAGFDVAVVPGGALTLGAVQPGADKRAAGSIVVARAGDDDIGGQPDGDQELPPEVLRVLSSWKQHEDNFAAIACVNAQQLFEFEKSTTKAIVLLNDALLAPNKDWSAIDLCVLEEAGKKLRIAAKQCRNGYLPVSSIVDAALTLNFMYETVLLQPNIWSVAVKFPPETSKILIPAADIPSSVPDPDAYYADMVLGMSKLVDTIDHVFRWVVKSFWSLG